MNVFQFQELQHLHCEQNRYDYVFYKINLFVLHDFLFLS